MGAAEQSQIDRKHIFIVNCSPDFLDILRDLFQEEQYNVTTTNFVPNTFDQIDALQPDLLIVDLVVGQKAGWNLLEHLTHEATTREIPIIVCSTSPHILEKVQESPDRFGGQRFLGKPVDLNTILDAVTGLIGGA